MAMEDSGKGAIYMGYWLINIGQLKSYLMAIPYILIVPYSHKLPLRDQ